MLDEVEKMSKYILETQNLSYQYPDGTPALQGVSLQIEKGKKIALLGLNGAGKTTLFLHFNGLLKPSKGKVFFAGKEIQYSQRALLELRKKVGIVFQDPDSQLFAATVWQDVSFGPLNLDLPETVVEERVGKALEATGTIHLKDKPTHFLSYGQKKSVSIADVLAMEPEVIIFDEPTAWLDPQHTEKIISTFERINHGGTTIILSTHDIDLAYAWADQIIIMKDGQLAGAGIPEEILEDSQFLQSCGLIKPTILEIYQELKKKNCLTGGKIPRNKEDLLKIIGKNEK